MTEFQMSSELPAQGPAPERKVDTRTLIEKMFFDFDTVSGKKVPLNVVPMTGDDDYKRVQDAIPLMRAYKKDDEAYEGPLKGKDVLVFGGRRRGRAGTGVELLLAVDDVAGFCALVQEVAKVARKT